MYVPDGPCCIHIVKECHDDALAGHFGVAKTLELISRSYWWPQPWKLVKNFVKTCDTCARAKAVHHRPYGYFNLCQFQIGHGPPSRRILSPTSPTLRESIQYWWWLIDSQRWRILFHVLKQFQEWKRLIYCLQILCAFTVYRMTLSLIAVPNLCLISGNASSKLSELPQNFRQPSILRQTAKQNVGTFSK